MVVKICLWKEKNAVKYIYMSVKSHKITKMCNLQKQK